MPCDLPYDDDFVERPFCKYACPYGAVLGVFNLFRIFGIKRRKSSCISCKACDKACPMNIDVSGAGHSPLGPVEIN